MFLNRAFSHELLITMHERNYRVSAVSSTSPSPATEDLQSSLNRTFHYTWDDADTMTTPVCVCFCVGNVGCGSTKSPMRHSVLRVVAHVVVVPPHAIHHSLGCACMTAASHMFHCVWRTLVGFHSLIISAANSLSLQICLLMALCMCALDGLRRIRMLHILPVAYEYVQE